MASRGHSTDAQIICHGSSADELFSSTKVARNETYMHNNSASVLLRGAQHMRKLRKVLPSALVGRVVRSVRELQSVFNRPTLDPAESRERLKKVLDEKTWTLCHDADGQPFDDFAKFARAALPYGLGVVQQESAIYLRDLLISIGAMREWVAFLSANVTVPGRRPDAEEEQRRRFYCVSTAATAIDRLLIRMSKEKPVFLEGLYAGKYESIRAAARAAEIIPPSACDPWKVLKEVRNAFGRLSEEEQISLIVELAADVSDQAWAKLRDKLKERQG